VTLYDQDGIQGWFEASIVAEPSVGYGGAVAPDGGLLIAGWHTPAPLTPSLVRLDPADASVEWTRDETPPGVHAATYEDVDVSRREREAGALPRVSRRRHLDLRDDHRRLAGLRNRAPRRRRRSRRVPGDHRRHPGRIYLAKLTP
jgi:hypothetical protein